MATRRTFTHRFDDRALDARPTASKPARDPLTSLDPCSCALVDGRAAVQVYNEEAFRYFLEIERKRSDLSNRPFLLLLLDLKKRTHGTDIDATTAERLFTALATCLRETDFIGWYRAGSVVGAVLTQHADEIANDAQTTVRIRVMDVVAKRVSHHLANRVQVRVYQASPAAQSE